MELKHYLSLIYRRIWLVALAALAAMAASYLLFRSRLPWPPYTATATMLISDEDQGSASIQAIIATYMELAARRPVTQSVVEELNLSMTADELNSRIRVRNIGASRLIEISVVDNDPIRAAAIANEIAAQLSQLHVSSTRGSARLLAGAKVSTGPDTSPYMGVIIAGITGIALASGVVILFDYLDTRIRTPDGVMQQLGLQTFGVVRFYKGAKPGELSAVWRRLQKARTSHVVHEEADVSAASLLAAISDDCRRVRINLDAFKRRAPVRLLVTSPTPVPHKLLTCVGLANAWAELDREVMLLDVGSFEDGPDQRSDRSYDLQGEIEREDCTQDDHAWLELVDERVAVRLPGHLRLPAHESGVLGRLKGRETHLNRVIDYAALVGDSRGGIPGVYGVGEKTALWLLGEYDTLDNIYTRLSELPSAIKGRLEAGRESAYFGKTLAANLYHENGFSNFMQLYETLDDWAEQSDVLIVNSPPVLSTATTAMLASKVGDVLLVLEADVTQTSMAQQAVTILAQAGSNVLGVVLLDGSRASLQAG